MDSKSPLRQGTRRLRLRDDNRGRVGNRSYCGNAEGARAGGRRIDTTGRDEATAQAIQDDPRDRLVSSKRALFASRDYQRGRRDDDRGWSLRGLRRRN
jgi:hypothetical protein